MQGMRVLQSYFFLSVAILAAGCSSGRCEEIDAGTHAAERQLSVGGNVTGLEGTGLVLSNNGGDELAITTSGPFTFGMPLASGARYSVTVIQQPLEPLQRCEVTGGSGTVGEEDVTTVAVSC